MVQKTCQTSIYSAFGGTDSFVYGFKHPDIHEWVKENKQHYDLSD